MRAWVTQPERPKGLGLFFLEYGQKTKNWTAEDEHKSKSLGKQISFKLKFFIGIHVRYVMTSCRQNMKYHCVLQCTEFLKTTYSSDFFIVSCLHFTFLSYLVYIFLTCTVLTIIVSRTAQTYTDLTNFAIRSIY